MDEDVRCKEENVHFDCSERECNTCEFRCDLPVCALRGDCGKCNGCSYHPLDYSDSFPVGYIGGDLEDYYNSVALTEVERRYAEI